MTPEEKEQALRNAWHDYVIAIATIVDKYGYLPTPVYKEFFVEATLTRNGEIAMTEATEKEIETSRQVLAENSVDKVVEKE